MCYVLFSKHVLFTIDSSNTKEQPSLSLIFKTNKVPYLGTCSKTVRKAGVLPNVCYLEDDFLEPRSKVDRNPARTDLERCPVNVPRVYDFDL